MIEIMRKKDRYKLIINELEIFLKGSIITTIHDNISDHLILNIDYLEDTHHLPYPYNKYSREELAGSEKITYLTNGTIQELVTVNYNNL